MDDFIWDDLAVSFTSETAVTHGYRKPCKKCSAAFTARSERDQFCSGCTRPNASRNLHRQNRYFRGFDGEGINTLQGHVYNLMGLGNEQLVTDHDIQWYEALEWLYARYDPDRINVVFCGKYDWACIFKSLPGYRGKKLFDAEYGERNIPKPYPVDTDASETPDGSRWLIRLCYGERLLEFKPKRCNCSKSECEHSKAFPWMRVMDVYDYFGRSFSDVIKDDPTLGTPEQRTIVLEGKAARDQGMSQDKLRIYNRVENELLAEAMSRIRAALAEVDIHPPADEWYGLGHAGQIWMRTHKVPSRKTCQMPDELVEAGRASYFGPWLEDIACGIVQGEAHEYDLNSAFCSILADMPCLEHGWTYHTGQPGALQAGHLRIEHVYLSGPGADETRLELPMPLGPALYREDKSGLILSPIQSAGWHWRHELDAREANGLIVEEQVTEYWEKSPCDCPKPFGAITELYAMRQKYRKGSIEGHLFKLLPDTVYGKLAESGKHSKYGNPVYASYVTSMCRALVLWAIHSHQDGVYGVLKITSDGFFTRNPHQDTALLPGGSGLGQWKYKTHHNLTGFEPGLWWSDETQKYSGIHQSAIAFMRARTDMVFKTWRRDAPGLNQYPAIDIPIAFRITTLSEAAYRSWAEAGKVETNRTETRRYNPGGKRDAAFLGINYDDKFQFFRIYPLAKGSSGLESAPYRKRMGWDNESDKVLGYWKDGANIAGIRREIGTDG